MANTPGASHDPKLIRLCSRTFGGDLNETLALLHKNGLGPVVSGGNDPTLTYRRHYSVEIYLPPDQIEKGQAVLASAEQNAQPAVREITRSIRVQILQSLSIALGIAGITWVVKRDLGWAGAVLVPAWIGGMVLISMIDAMVNTKKSKDVNHKDRRAKKK